MIVEIKVQVSECLSNFKVLLLTLIRIIQINNQDNSNISKIKDKIIERNISIEIQDQEWILKLLVSQTIKNSINNNNKESLEHLLQP